MYTVKPVVSDYGIFRGDELCMVCNRKRNAELIVKILEVDDGRDVEHHHDGIARDFEVNGMKYQGDGTFSKYSIKEIMIDNVGLSSRTCNALKRGGIYKLTDIKSVQHLNDIRNIGEKAMGEILSAFAEMEIQIE